MAKRNATAAGRAIPNAAGPVPVGVDRPYDPNNRHAWLPLFGDPGGATTARRIMHGTLRREYRGHANTAEAFAAAKLQVVPSLDRFAVTAIRHEVLVPRDAPDVFADPWLLPTLIDHAAARETKPSTPLLCYVTVSEPQVAHLHEQWRRGRAIVKALVDRFAVPMLLVQHDPSQSGSRNPPHLHVLSGVAMLGRRGFGGLVSELANDKARDIFVHAWR